MNEFNLVFNKKVLLRERKRHTDRGVSSTPSVVLYWAVPPARGVLLLGGTPPWVPPSDLARGVPHPWQGVPHLRYPPLDLARVPPHQTWLGYPLSGPGQGTPSPLLDLAGVSPIHPRPPSDLARA